MATERGGKKLEAALKRLSEKIARPATLRVGFLEGATYPNGTNVAAVAFWNNYGTQHIPPRPFFGNMIADKSPEWPSALAQLLKDNDYDAVRALDLAGVAIEGQLKQAIVDTNSPPLAESTIKAKGFEKPLIETSHMLNSTGHEVNS